VVRTDVRLLLFFHPFPVEELNRLPHAQSHLISNTSALKNCSQQAHAENKQTNKERNKQTNKQRNKQTNKETIKQASKRASKQANN
jgi:hypothetical protein